MRPVCSATGMNSSGATGEPPASGQRMSASTPTTASVLSETLGWKCGDDALLLQRPAQLAGERSRGRGAACIVLATQLERGSAAAGVLHGELGGAEQRVAARAVPRVGRRANPQAYVET